eukprot:CAMPEP_0181474890 /NCGR_PEP_ID=MMETSP1110-20121109/40895_1 /TAXON_ID=174948 /ORGANISM="Symbiodinium sp., Strain CCMP421" /LENGTH=636 /DNA_ID=CAMNT_0023600097 /DNA_START=59 /DNA_END=1969 /DNA_ORIENTATION=-
MQSLFTAGLVALAVVHAAAAKAAADLKGMDIASLAGEPLAKVADPLNAGTVEGALTGLLKAGSEATNNTAVAGTILDIVNVSMKEKLYAAHNESLKKIEEASQQFNDCLTTYKAADEVRFPPTSLLQTNGSNGSAWYEEYFEAYSWCKSYEANLSVQTQDCEYYCLKETQTIDQQCVALDEECNQLDCTPVSHEGYRAFLERVVANIEKHMGLNSDWNFNVSHKCKDIKGEVETCYKNCDDIVEVVKPKTEEAHAGCCAPRATAESAKCNELKNRRTAWEAYDTCYDTASSNWDTVKNEHEAQGVSRAAQMRSILRMVCLISSFGEDQKEKLQKCMDSNFTQHAEVLEMKIAAGDPAEKLEVFACNASEVPGSTEFDALHYGNLPKGVSACPAVTCASACGVSSPTSSHFEEVEVCVALNAWQKDPISTTEGWSKMGSAYFLGADRECKSELFWNSGTGECEYAACPDNSVRNTEDAAPTSGTPTKGPGSCPCKMKMHRKTTTIAPLAKKAVEAKCFKQDGSAVYFDLGSAQSLGNVSAVVTPGNRVEVFLTNTDTSAAPATSESCGLITESSTSVDCSPHSAGRFLVFKGTTAGTCVHGDCSVSWCQVQLEGKEMTQDPALNTGSTYTGKVIVDA